MDATPLDAPFGAELLLDLDGPLRDSDAEALRRLFSQHGLLVVRGREISPALQIDLLSALGRIEPDTSGAPMKMEVTNQHARSSAPDGELIFHYDYAYDVSPVPAIAMY